MSPYRENAKPREDRPLRLIGGVVLGVVLAVLLGFGVGMQVAPDTREVAECEECEECEKSEEPELSFREQGCLGICGDAGVAWFARNDGYGYACQCLGADSEIGTLEGLWD